MNTNEITREIQLIQVDKITTEVENYIRLKLAEMGISIGNDLQNTLKENNLKLCQSVNGQHYKCWLESTQKVTEPMEFNIDIRSNQCK